MTFASTAANFGQLLQALLFTSANYSTKASENKTIRRTKIIDMQHGLAARKRRTDMLHGHAARTSSRDMQHGHAARTYIKECSEDMQDVHAA